MQRRNLTRLLTAAAASLLAVGLLAACTTAGKPSASSSSSASGPDVRENEPILGTLDQDFNFSQAPRPPVLLATNPSADSPSIPAYFRGQPPCAGCTTLPPALGPKNAKKANKSNQDTDG